VAECERRIAVVVARPFAEVDAFLRDPLNWPAWASGLAADIVKVEDGWRIRNPSGEAHLRFVAPDAAGVYDHVVTLPDGREVHMPMRAASAGGGTEIALTLIRQPEITDEDFARDGRWIEDDLGALKRRLEDG
jgi:hypothetical protein